MVGVLTGTLFLQSAFAEICALSQRKAEYVRMNESSIRKVDPFGGKALRTDGDFAFPPDGKSVAFINRPSQGAAEIWVGALPAASPFKRVLKEAIRFDGSLIADKVDLQFSADGKALLFLVPLADTYFGLARLDLVTGETKALKSRVIAYCSLHRGKEAGRVVAQLRKGYYFGVWSWYWLLDAGGSEIVPIGDDDAVRFFFFELDLVR